MRDSQKYLIGFLVNAQKVSVSTVWVTIQLAKLDILFMDFKHDADTVFQKSKTAMNRIQKLSESSLEEAHKETIEGMLSEIAISAKKYLDDERRNEINERIAYIYRILHPEVNF